MRKITGLFLTIILGLGLVGCSCKEVKVPSAQAGEFDMNSQTFGVDKNVNVNTIDKYLGLDNVVYRDMRLLVDSQGYDGLAPNSSGMLTATIKGFKVSPLPYIANLWEGMLPPPVLDNPIDDQENLPLFNVTWGEHGEVISVSENYEESMYVLKEIFPEDKLIFLMCGGGGYAWMTKQILLKLGYEEDKVYNIGGFWAYDGKNKVDMVTYYDSEGSGLYEDKFYSFYNADYMNIKETLNHLTKKVIG